MIITILLRTKMVEVKFQTLSLSRFLIHSEENLLDHKGYYKDRDRRKNYVRVEMKSSISSMEDIGSLFVCSKNAINY
jgi:hypothetical protein